MFIILLGLTSGSLLHVTPPKTLYFLLFSPIRATCFAYLIFLDLITQVGSTDYEALWGFFSRLLTPSTLGQNILRGILLSNALSLRCSLKMRNQLAQDIIIRKYLNLYMFT
jgi:hypothetical protein